MLDMSSVITLSSLLKDIVDVPKGADISVSAMTLDSREVAEGTLFVALKGLQQHGLAYAEVAQKQGAVAIIWEADDSVLPAELSIPVIKIAGLRGQLGLIADRFYGAPSQSLKMVGITGTDGKTSISHFMAQAIDNCAVIGTIGVGRLDDLQKATHTTPDILSVHKYLSEMKAQGVATVAMEVSSHALDQGRVDNVAFDVAVLSNLSRDHLDYHKTVEAYAEAKEKLFSWPDLKMLVLNFDDDFGLTIAQDKNIKKGGCVLPYGIGSTQDYPQGSLVAENVVLSSQGISADISYGDEKGQLAVSVLGSFNLSNLLATLGAMIGLGWSFTDALQKVNRVKTVEGRMEKVSDADVLTVVDFAHTPNALETVLKALREHTRNKLICVFGCGGDRDTGKRPLMAAITEQYADVVIVTDDNPRTENPEVIMQGILAGFKQPQEVTVEHDRARAISMALHQAKTGDAVLITGKGHENVQILAKGTVPFSDKKVANKVLQELAA